MHSHVSSKEIKASRPTLEVGDVRYGFRSNRNRYIGEQKFQYSFNSSGFSSYDHLDSTFVLRAFRATKHTYVNPFISWRRIDPSYVVPLSKFDSSNSQGSEKHAVVFGDTLVRNLCATSESSNLYPVFIPQKVSISP